MKILVVEDDPGVALLLRKYLAGIPDTEVEVVTDLSQAKLAFDRIPPPDIVTLDLLLPDSAAEGTLSEIAHFRQVNPDGCVVVMTGLSTDSAIEQKSLKAGADGFLQKNIVGRRSDFLEGVKNALTTKRDTPKYQQYISVIEALTSTLRKA